MRSLAILAVCLLSALAQAHPLAPSLLELREATAGEVTVRWKTPSQRVRGSRLAPRLPEACRIVAERSPDTSPLEAVTEWNVTCDGSLTGRRIAVDGIAASRADVLVRLELADGRRILRVLRPGDESFVVPERDGPAAMLASYARLGIAHIATGFDHLCFVLGLLLLVGGGRRLLGTVTAFTLGHSITLSLAALGLVAFPVRAIEVLIAASIFVLAVELTGERRGWLGQRPWTMAGAFGLLHGFGFAGALAEVGLPAGDVPLALLGFNAGIEIGQLAFVLAVLSLGRFARPAVALLPRARLVPAYAMGPLAGFWMLRRLIETIG